MFLTGLISAYDYIIFQAVKDWLLTTEPVSNYVIIYAIFVAGKVALREVFLRDFSAFHCYTYSTTVP
jgi:hypothetical protein